MRKHKEGLTPERIAEMEAELRFHDTVSDTLSKHLSALENQLEVLNAEVSKHIDACNDLEEALYEPVKPSGKLVGYGVYMPTAEYEEHVAHLCELATGKKQYEPDRLREWWQSEWDYQGTKLSDLREVEPPLWKLDVDAGHLVFSDRVKIDFSLDGIEKVLDTPLTEEQRKEMIAMRPAVFFSKELEFSKEPYLGTDKCRCDMSTIMATGCKCGGK